MDAPAVAYVPTPVGTLRLAGDAAVLRGIAFEPAGGWGCALRGARPPAGLLVDVARQLSEYFARRRRDFDLPLEPAGTAFQRDVWACLRRIPYGEAISYRELARRIGRPTAVRAVGAANGANPIPIVIPCHRVLGANGSLTGFGGGLAVKAALLALESAQLPLAPARA